MSKTRFSGPLQETDPQDAYNVKVSKKSFAYGDSSPVVAVTIPANGYVVATVVNITTAFDGTGAAVTIGDGADADRFMDAAAIACDATGWKHSYDDAQPGSKGHLYSSQDTVDIAITPGSGATAGAGALYVIWAEVA